MFAVLKTGGKQYKVVKNDILIVEKLSANEGDTVQFDEILIVADKEIEVGSPRVDGAAVHAEVIEQKKSKKVISFVKRRRKHSSKRTKGHRQNVTVLRIKDILVSGAIKKGVSIESGSSIIASKSLSGNNKTVTKKPAFESEGVNKTVSKSQSEVKSIAKGEIASKPATKSESVEKTLQKSKATKKPVAKAEAVEKTLPKTKATKKPAAKAEAVEKTSPTAKATKKSAIKAEAVKRETTKVATKKASNTKKESSIKK